MFYIKDSRYFSINSRIFHKKFVGFLTLTFSISNFWISVEKWMNEIFVLYVCIWSCLVSIFMLMVKAYFVRKSNWAYKRHASNWKTIFFVYVNPQIFSPKNFFEVGNYWMYCDLNTIFICITAENLNWYKNCNKNFHSIDR